MEQNLQEFNTKQKLLEWSQRISECRNSGMSVKDWCKANGIPVSIYYNQQRKVYEDVLLPHRMWNGQGGGHE